MAGNIIGFIAVLVLSLWIAIMVHALIRSKLRGLLDEALGLPAATAFYSRMLLIGLVFIALRTILGTQFGGGADMAFMEHVWKVADALSSEFGLWCLFLTVYLVVITILVAALRRRNVQ